MTAANLLTQRWPTPSTGCFLSTTERRAPPHARTPGQRDVAERANDLRLALGAGPQVAEGALLRALDVPGPLPIMRAALRDDAVDVPWGSASEVRIDARGDTVEVVGPVPRSVAMQLAVTDGALPSGDPVVMTFSLRASGRSVTVEAPYFHFSEQNGARRERAYAFAESRATHQALGALLAGASRQTLASSPALSRAHAALRAVAAFEDGPEPGAGASRLVHRAARLQRARTYDIARALGPIYDCGLEPRTPAMIDEPRELPIAQAFAAAALAARNVDPALLYAVASEDGLQDEVESWHRGIGELEVPSRIDGSRALGLAAIADEIDALRRDGYLPSWFASAVRGDTGHPEFVSAGARSALTNALTFTAARLAYSRDRASEAATRLTPGRALEQRELVFLTLLHAEGGDVAVRRHLQDRRQRPMLATPAELRASPVVARAFARTALWEQMHRTGVFERAP